MKGVEGGTLMHTGTLAQKDEMVKGNRAGQAKCRMRCERGEKKRDAVRTKAEGTKARGVSKSEEKKKKKRKNNVTAGSCYTLKNFAHANGGSLLYMLMA